MYFQLELFSECQWVFKLIYLLFKVYRLRLLGDYHHSTRIAFVEFIMVSILTSSTVHVHILLDPSFKSFNLALGAY